jgi:peptidoglycan/xylan/chitin deacetylase (PgdA/CDA1 family)
MGSFLRAAIPLALAFAAGTWVGAGQPPPEKVRGWAERTAQGMRVTAPLASASAPASGPPMEAAAPPSVDPTALPDPVPWPRQNPLCSTTKAWLLAEGPARDGATARRLVTLTFDDGPFPETTPTALKLLDRHRVKATFFFVSKYLVGDWERPVAAREVAKQVVAAGHLVGSHGRSHVALGTTPHAQVLSEMDDSLDTIQKTIGTRPALFRPPYGSLDAFGEQAARARGLELVLWSVEADDMRRDDEDAMFADLTRQIDFKGGGVVLLHDVRWSSVRVLGRLLDWLDARKWDRNRPTRAGYDVVDLVTYLKETAARPQPYADRAGLERARAEAWRHAHPKPHGEPAGS